MTVSSILIAAICLIVGLIIGVTGTIVVMMVGASNNVVSHWGPD